VADCGDFCRSVVASQLTIHRKYGLLRAELASPLNTCCQIAAGVREALAHAGMKLADVDAIGLTQGLRAELGALLVELLRKTLAQRAGSARAR